MKKSYYYYIYGEFVKINIQMPLLNEIVYPSNQRIINVDIKYGVAEKINYIKRKKDYYIVSCASAALYKIYESESKIECVAIDFESFFSTFFNLPFSVYFLLRNEVLLHCCTMNTRDKAICFSGEKGIGKSTLTALLNNERCHLFSDDTLHIKKDMSIHKAHNLIKFTTETLNSLKINFQVTDTENLMRKKYSIFPESKYVGNLSAVIQLVKGENDFFLKNIDGFLSVKNIFHKNIVGIHLFDKYLFAKMLELKFYENLQFYILTIPNNLKVLIPKKEKIFQLIEKEILL